MTCKLTMTFISICFAGACTHKTDAYNFETIKTVTVDESKIVLTTYPSQLAEIDDSLLAAVNSYKTISLYNVETGKNKVNFNLNQINFDSLMKLTYQRHYEGLRKYVYDTTNDGLGDEQGQVKAFQYRNGKFHILITTLANVEYINDAAALKAMSQNEEVRALKAKYGNIQLRVTDYMNFLFTTDREFKILDILPLYESTALRKLHYYPIFQKAFMEDGGHIYTYISKDDESYENMRAPKKPQEHYLAKLRTENAEELECLLSANDIDYAGFSINDFYGKKTELKFSENKLLYSNSREICEVTTGKKLFAGKNLQKNEFIDGWSKDKNDCFVMVTHLMSPKHHPTKFEVHYAVDSIHSHKIKVFDNTKQQWIAEGKLPAKVNGPFSVGHSKIIYCDRDDQHYLLKVIPYNEN